MRDQQSGIGNRESGNRNQVLNPVCSNVGYLTIPLGDACYVYDTATNAIVRAPRAVDAVLKDYLGIGERGVVRKFAGKLPANELEDAIEFLRINRASGMLRPMRRVDYLPFTCRANVRRLYDRPVQVMTLGVTEHCNQRCRYCPFGNANRGRRPSRRMDWDTARHAIDYALSHADPKAAPTIDLFGGEPLLNWPVVERAVRYIRQELRRRDVPVLVYTNATAIDRPKLAFLIANKVVLQVSMDGPPTVHDRDRVDTQGVGTHARVLRVLRWIRRRHPGYYRRYVRLQVTFRLESDLLKVFRYFDRPMFRAVTIGFVYRSGGRSRAADRMRHQAQLDELVERYLKALRGRRPFHRELFAHIMSVRFVPIEQRRVGPPPRHPEPNSACAPGRPMLFAAADGTFHPCCNYTAPGSGIGDACTGIDMAKAQSLLEAYARLCNEICQDCWAWRICSQCYVHAIDGRGRWSRARKERVCRLEREHVAQALRRYAYIWHNEPAWASRSKHTVRYAATHGR